MTPVELLRIFDLAGVAVFAISGALAAGRKSLDLLGVVVIAIVTAVGGGTLRDLLLDRSAFWIVNPTYLLTIIAAALCTMVYVRFRRAPEQALLVADALGLAFFSISGAQIAEASGTGGLIAVVMGTITGVFGGVLRDVLCAEIPMILRKGNIYATAAIVGTSAYVVLQDAGVIKLWAAVAGILVIVALRLAAIIWQLSLPVFTLEDRR
ncbi:trimeric intracellular cation channel family protein [Polycyclovorans algicola]|uniref:trimeric intracellular cation channel family protein n=1 Tax=Polycyclovorans algicola TaxID=616992 RepID=UPI0004A70817|nr:trimeric intracellular cation channel family protein [Polycyclovorans algicola]